MHIIVPCYKPTRESLTRLYASIRSQSRFDSFIHVIVDGEHDKDHYPVTTYSLFVNDGNCKVDLLGKRNYALKNIIDHMPEKGLVGIIDGDDQLIDWQAIEMVEKEYEAGNKIIWTDHVWNKNGANQSGPYDRSISPYKHPWVTSHFRCFDAELFHLVNKKNFNDPEGNIFKRCYDQALMLPMLHIANVKGLPIKYIPRITYLYTGNFEIGGEGHKYQMELAEFIRQRGYID